MIWWNVWVWYDRAWIYDPVVCVLADDWWRARGLAADLLGMNPYDLHVGQHPKETGGWVEPPIVRAAIAWDRNR